ncbi:ABC transporter permease [Kineosporia sp. R_H_3]|uniref:ABC transporter permease n=1 Tax=Kineosporia sp. R_H_3 TaxID=1961848 RepID=UPI000B4ACA1B|nr:ABC transporter permease subunit [Kineosporia sp. R_H_3]
MRRAVGAPLLVTGLLAGLLAPLVLLAVWSVTRTWRYPALWPQSFGDRAVRVVTDPGSQILSGLVTSAGIAATVAVVSGAVGLAAGRALGLHSFPGKGFVRFALLAPVVVPGITVSLGIQVVFIHYRLADTVPGVVLAHLIPATPYATLVLAAAYTRFDTAFEDQARVLGTSPLRVLVHVTLPALRPALTVAMMLTFLISWNEYVLTLLVGGGSVTTLPLLLFSAIGSGDTALAAALALVVSVPPLLLVGVTARALTGAGASTGSGETLAALGRA